MTTRFKTLAILLIMLVAGCSSTAPTQEKSDAADPAIDQASTASPAKVEVSGIDNFSQVDGTSGVAGSTSGFGGATQPSAMPQLKEMGFASVINLRLATEEGATVDASRVAAEMVDLNYIHLPFDVANPDPELVDNFASVVANTDNQPVYVHCNSASRVAGLWMIVRVLEDGWEIERASKEAEAIAKKPDEAIGFATKYLASRKPE